MADGRGRPRSFDIEQTLEQALVLFWQGGYLGTTYTDICKATGLGTLDIMVCLTTFGLCVNSAILPGVYCSQAFIVQASKSPESAQVLQLGEIRAVRTVPSVT